MAGMQKLLPPTTYWTLTGLGARGINPSFCSAQHQVCKYMIMCVLKDLSQKVYKLVHSSKYGTKVRCMHEINQVID